MQMEAWLLLLSSCSSWCTRRRWWKTRPLACLCWRFRLQIQTWELMARSPTPSTVPTQTSSISTTGQVWWCLFGVKTRVFSLSELCWVAIPSTLQLLREALCCKEPKTFLLSFFSRVNMSTSFTSITLYVCHNISLRYRILQFLAIKASKNLTILTIIGSQRMNPLS